MRILISLSAETAFDVVKKTIDQRIRAMGSARIFLVRFKSENLPPNHCSVTLTKSRKFPTQMKPSDLTDYIAHKLSLVTLGEAFDIYIYDTTVTVTFELHKDKTVDNSVKM